MKKCSKCREEKPIENFSPCKRNEDGSVRYRHSWCNSCRTVNNRERGGFQERNTGYVGDDEKECLWCRKIKNIGEFSPASKNKRGLGKSSYCKSCRKDKYYNKENAKKYTYRYRTRHRERYLANHRLRQFKRRSQIEATDDGTVDDLLLKEIYSRENCYWCGMTIEPENRTLEHIEELSSGGKHSRDNLTMACRSCNSSRKNRRK